MDATEGETESVNKKTPKRTGVVTRQTAVVLHLTQADWEFLLAQLDPSGKKWIRTRSRPVLPSERVMELMMRDL